MKEKAHSPLYSRCNNFRKFKCPLRSLQALLTGPGPLFQRESSAGHQLTSATTSLHCDRRPQGTLHKDSLSLQPVTSEGSIEQKKITAHLKDASVPFQWHRTDRHKWKVRGRSQHRDGITGRSGIV